MVSSQTLSLSDGDGRSDREDRYDGFDGFDGYDGFTEPAFVAHFSAEG
jgi:hypothetical protein